MRGRILAAALCLTGLLSFAAYGDQWVEIEDGVWEYRLDDGTYLTDGFTPDGYFIDGSGRWTENAVVLETEVPNRNSFLPPTDENAFLDYADILNDVQRVLYRDLGDIRRFRISDDRTQSKNHTSSRARYFSPAGITHGSRRPCAQKLTAS